MNFFMSIAIFTACFGIGVVTNGGTGVFVLALCGICFAWGCSIYAEIVFDKAKNGELIEYRGKYYAVKYIKDKE